MIKHSAFIAGDYVPLTTFDTSSWRKLSCFDWFFHGSPHHTLHIVKQVGQAHVLASQEAVVNEDICGSRRLLKVTENKRKDMLGRCI